MNLNVSKNLDTKLFEIMKQLRMKIFWQQAPTQGSHSVTAVSADTQGGKPAILPCPPHIKDYLWQFYSKFLQICLETCGNILLSI